MEIASTFPPQNSPATGYSPQAVAAFFLGKDAEREDSDVTQMKLHKLLYFAQANHLASTGDRLFDAHIEAFRHGPVVEPLRKTYEPYNRQIIVVENPAATIAQEELPPAVTDFLELIWDRFGNDSAAALRELSHQDAPWAENYDPTRPHCLIPDDQMAAFYRSLTGHRRVEVPDVFVGTFEEFTEEDEAKMLAFFKGVRPL